MAVTAAQVRELRESTGAGMMDCKKALEVTGGDIARAVEELRKTGLARADKKAGRAAAEGIILIRSAGSDVVMLEINCETDFVARGEDFLAFADEVAGAAISGNARDVAELLEAPLQNDSGLTVDGARKALVARVGENINIRRFVRTTGDAGSVGSYLHGTRIGVLVEMDCNDPDLPRDIAMHVAASRPIVVSQQDVPAELVEKEKEIYAAQASASGKPQDIIEKMIAGRLGKFMDEVSLLGQPFVRDPGQTVATLLARHHAKVLRFSRFEVGEGVDKKPDDFVGEVMAQVQGKQ